MPRGVYKRKPRRRNNEPDLKTILLRRAARYLEIAKTLRNTARKL